MEVPAEMRIVLLGKTGSGKSSAGNIILGEEKFEVSPGLNSVTQDCQTEEGNFNGMKISVTDTPGIFDPERSDEDLKYSIVSCLTECAPGPHAFILVLRVGRYTKEEQESVRNIQKWFGEEALKHTVVLFTHGYELVKTKQCLFKYVEEKKELKQLIDKCEGRVYAIDSMEINKTDDLLKEVRKLVMKGVAGKTEAGQTMEGLMKLLFEQGPSTSDQELGQCSGRPTSTGGNLNEYRSNSFQIKQMLTTIDNMMRESGDSYYTNEALQLIAGAIQDEVNKIIQEKKNEICNEARKNKEFQKNMDSDYTNESLQLMLEDMQDEGDKIKQESMNEIWKEARRRIRNKILQSEVVGGTVGSLLGLLLGVAVGALVPLALLAGLLTAGVKSVCGSRPTAVNVNGKTLKAVGVAEGTAAVAGTAVAVGTALGTSVAKAGVAGAAIGAGAATGIGVGVAAGVYAVAGAVRGGMAGAKAGETCIDTNRAAKEAAKATGQAGFSTLKEVWDATQNLARYKESPYRKLQ